MRVGFWTGTVLWASGVAGAANLASEPRVVHGRALLQEVGHRVNFVVTAAAVASLCARWNQRSIPLDV